MTYSYDADGRDDRESNGVNGGLLAFPDILAPAAAAGVVNDDARYVSDYSFPRDSPRHHSSSLFDTSSFNVSISFIYVYSYINNNVAF